MGKRIVVSCVFMLAACLSSHGVDPPASTEPGGACRELRVLTYNVLADEVHTAQRVPELLRLMRDARADIIALQEVTPWFARALMRESWFDEYHRATHEGKTVLAHEHIVLSRYPVLDHAILELPGEQGRVAHIVSVEIAGVRTGVATCHLESLLEDGKMRARQLEIFFNRLAEFPQVFFAGDFNFGDGEQPETAAIPATYHDAWLAVRPADPGFTWDMERSRMARDASFPTETSRRLDRILFRSAQWIPVSAELVGWSPAPGRKRHVFPSDHFGVLAVFRPMDASAESAVRDSP